MKIHAVCETSKGPFSFELFSSDEPEICDHFISLIRKNTWTDGVTGEQRTDGFFDNSPIGPVIFQTAVAMPNKNFAAPSFDEQNINYSQKHTEGAVSLARGGDNHLGGIFFICIRPMPQYDNLFPVFGKITKGIETVSLLTEKDTLHRIWLEEY
ncbi:MAG: peptidylprolyl isomerase [Deltaproteobacteria bacterium]|nr:peptidylprolyl isomerase [Deltaproteobacteria bacterium]